MSIILLKNNEAEPAEPVVEAVSCTSDLPSHRLCHPIVIMLANIHSTPYPNVAPEVEEPILIVVAVLFPVSHLRIDGPRDDIDRASPHQSTDWNNGPRLHVWAGLSSSLALKPNLM